MRIISLLSVLIGTTFALDLGNGRRSRSSSSSSSSSSEYFSGCPYVLSDASEPCCESSSSSCSSSSSRKDCGRVLKAIVKQPPFRGLQYLQFIQADIINAAQANGSRTLLLYALNDIAKEFGVKIRFSDALGARSSLLDGTSALPTSSGVVTDFGAMRTYALNVPTLFLDGANDLVKYAFQVASSKTGLFILFEIWMDADYVPRRQIRIKNSNLTPNGW